MPPEDKKGVRALGKEPSAFWDFKNNVPNESCRKRRRIKWRMKTM